jgi:hypothetical protein
VHYTCSEFVLARSDSVSFSVSVSNGAAAIDFTSVLDLHFRSVTRDTGTTGSCLGLVLLPFIPTILHFERLPTRILSIISNVSLDFYVSSNTPPVEQFIIFLMGHRLRLSISVFSLSFYDAK